MKKLSQRIFSLIVLGLLVLLGGALAPTAAKAEGPYTIAPSDLTVVTNSDETARYAPAIGTVSSSIDYAVTNSPTDSVYTLIYTPVAFADTKGHWAEDILNDMGSRKLVTGYDDGTFHPDSNITRAEFAAIMVRALELAEKIGENQFIDVADSDWYCQAIQTAASYGIITGYEDNTFGPNDAITREDAMTMIARAMKITNLDAGLSDEEIPILLANYRDMQDVSGYAKESIAACLKTGILSGRENAILAPQEPMTRAEVAAAVQRLLVNSGLINDTSSNKANDAADYSAAENWLALPSSVDKEVDVFYLYPTAYYKLNENDPIICDINNAFMMRNAGLAFQRQATAFETVGNIYAPYYRQADAAYCLSLSAEEQNHLLGGIIKSDVFAAFDYYIKNYNNGRPFILAGHSLGSNMLLYLLSEYMAEHPDVYQRMVAAYVIGYSVTEDYLAANPHLEFAQSADDTGVIISYNTQAPTIQGKNPVVLPGALVINPITWTREESPATAEENLGSIMLNPDSSVVLDDEGRFKQVMNYADASVDLENGVLICSTVDVDTWAPGNVVFGRGVFHSFDYPFYYYNIRANAANRVDIFLNQ